MGLLVIVFMASQGYYAAPLIGLLGACFGCVCSTRLMQRFVLKAYPQYATEDAVSKEDIEEEEKEEGAQEEKTVFIRLLNAMLDGGRSGVEVGIAILPGEARPRAPPIRAGSCCRGVPTRSTLCSSGSSASTTRTSWRSPSRRSAQWALRSA